MAVAEFVAKITGDTSGLEKALQKANGSIRKLENDEVIVKLNYDGNVEGFNKEFAKIQKECPELSIQFQYNANQRMLDKERDKLKQLQELKLDVDTNGADKKIASMISELGSAIKNDAGEDVIKSKIKNIYKYANTIKYLGGQISELPEFDIYKTVSGTKYEQAVTEMLENNKLDSHKLFNFSGTLDEEIAKSENIISDYMDFLSKLEKMGASKTGLPSELQEVQEEIKILRSDIEEMQEQLENLSGDKFEEMAEQVRDLRDALSEVLTKLGIISTSSFKEIIPLLSSFGKPKGGQEAEYYEKIGKIFDSLDDKTKNLLKDLGLLNSQGGITPIIDGANNYGGLIGEKNTAIVRQDANIENAKKLKQALDEAYESGVNCSRIIDIVETADGKVVELQNTVKGNPLQDSEFNFDIGGLEATDKQIQKLYSDAKKLWDLGVAVDISNPSNLIYDSVKGFSIIDTNFIEDAKIPFNSFEDLWEDFKSNFEENLKYYEEEGNQDVVSVMRQFVANIEKAQSEMGDAAKNATKKAADAIQEAQDSHSPAKLTEPLGEDFGRGYAEGIRKAMPEIVEACKEIVLSAYNAINELNKTNEIDNTNIANEFVNGFKESLEKQRPVIQEKIKEVFSKFDIGEENSSLFSSMGQRIIDSIIAGIQDVHSSDNFADALLKVVNNAFENIMLGSAVDSLINRIYQKMGEALDNHTFNIVNFDVKTDTLVTSIQNGLNTHTFNVDLGGTVKELATAINTSADNVRMSFVDAIKWMHQANEWQRTNKDITHERTMLFNSKTGQFSNPTVVGNEKEVGYELTRKIIDYYKERGVSFDTDLHSHQDYNYAAPSSLDGDISYFFKHAFEDGIDKFIIMAQKEFAVFDFSKIASSVTEFKSFLKDWIADNLTEIEGEIGSQNGRTNSAYFRKYFDKRYIDLTKKYKEELSNEFDTNASISGTDARNTSKLIFRDLNKDVLSNPLTGNASATITDAFTAAREEIAKVLKVDPSSIKDSLNSVIKNIFREFEKAIDGFKDTDSLIPNKLTGIIDGIMNNMNIDGGEFHAVKNLLRNKIVEQITSLFNIKHDNFVQRDKRINNELLQESGSRAMKELMSGSDALGKLLNQLVKYYTPAEFEKMYGGIASKTSSQNKSGTSASPALAEDFQTQLQNAITETGEYIVKVYGELVQDFKTRLQNAIDKTDLYHVDIEGRLVNLFHDDLQRDIDGQDKYVIEVKGRLFKTFKQALQELIDKLGAFPIEVKPYIKKAEGIAEGGEQGGFVAGENVGNGVVGGFRKGIDAHSNSKEAEHATDDFANGVVDELEARTPDMVNVAEKAADSVSDAFNDALNGVENTDNLNDGTMSNNSLVGKSFNELINISGIEKGSDSLNAALRESMEHLKALYDTGDTESEEYIGTLYRIINLQKEMWKFNGGKGSSYDNLAKSTKDKGGKDVDVKMDLQDSIYKDFQDFSGTSKEVVDFVLDEFSRLKSDGSLIFDETGKLITASTRQRVQDVIDEVERETEVVRDNIEEQRNIVEQSQSSNKTTGLSSGSDKIEEQARAEMQAEEAAYDAAQRVKVEAERAGQAIAESQNKAQSEITDTTTLLHDLSELLHNLSRNNLKTFNSSHGNIFGELNEDNIESVYQRLEMIKNVISKTTRNDYNRGDKVVGGILDDNSLAKYNAYKELLEKIGYTLGEFKEGGMGWQADIVPISDKAIHNGEEMARILFDIQKYEQVSNEAPVSTESTNAETKAFLSKKEVVEQLRSELQLTQKAAEELFNQQGYDKTNGKYQIEQQAVDELIASLKKKKEVEESTEFSSNFESAITEYITDLEKTEVQADKTRQAIQNICDINTADSSVDFLAKELHKAEVEAKKLSSETIFKNKISKQAVDLDNQKIKTKDGTKYSEELTKRITDANKQIEELRNKLSSVSNDDQLKEWISEFNVLKVTIKGVNDAIREENSSSKSTSSTQSKSNKAKSDYIKLLKEENELRINNYKSKKNGESDEGFETNLADIEKRKQAIIDLINTEEREQFVKDKNAEYNKKYSEAIINIDQQIVKEEESIQKKRLSLAQQITQWLKANPVAEKKYGSVLNESIAQLNSSAKLTPEVLKQIEQEFKNIKLQATSAGETGSNFFTMLKKRWMALGTYLGSFTSFYRIVGGIRQAFSTILELDTQLVDLRKTTKMNTEELNEFYFSANNIAKQMGVTTSEIISQAAAWSRLNKIGHLCGNI